jgi:hypothetical protein
MFPIRLRRGNDGKRCRGICKAAQVVADHQQWSQFIGVFWKVLQTLFQRLSLLQ